MIILYANFQSEKVAILLLFVAWCVTYVDVRQRCCIIGTVRNDA